jgi:hypothetical protein
METTPKKNKAEKKKENVSSFLVKTKGYKETFGTLDRAKNQFEILKKRAIKNQNKVKIELFEKVKEGLILVDEVSISEDFFEN